MQLAVAGCEWVGDVSAAEWAYSFRTDKMSSAVRVSGAPARVHGTRAHIQCVWCVCVCVCVCVIDASCIRGNVSLCLAIINVNRKSECMRVLSTRSVGTCRGMLECRPTATCNLSRTALALAGGQVVRDTYAHSKHHVIQYGFTERYGGLPDCLRAANGCVGAAGPAIQASQGKRACDRMPCTCLLIHHLLRCVPLSVLTAGDATRLGCV
jgi:hypothetical protein